MGISVRLKIGSLFWTAIPNGLPKNCARPDLTLLPPPDPALPNHIDRLDTCYVRQAPRNQP
jgi:hypothetical protein